MYTNGLKDRFGSPLISLDEADERYILQGDIEFQHKKIEEKIYETEKFIDDLSDRHFSLGNKMHYATEKIHYVTEVLNNHVGDDTHFVSDQKEKFNNLFVKLDGLEEFTKETIPQSETTGDNGGEAFRMSALMLPVGQVIDEIIVPTKNTPTGSFFLGVYKILSTESVTSTNKTLVAISDEAITWTNGGEAIWSFNDTPFEIPEGYDLEIHIASAKEDFTATGTNYRASGVNELKCRYKDNATGYGACRYQTRWYENRAICVILKRKGVQGHIGDDTHLSENQREVLNEIVTNGFAAKNQFDIFLEETKQKQQYYDTWINLNDGRIDPLISRLSTYNRYETNYFSTNIESSNSVVSSFRFGYKHFPHGLVKRVSLYGRDAITSNIPEAHTTGCYLMANIYKKDGTLVSSTSSTNKLVAQFRPDNSTVVLNTWEFDNLVSPKEDEVIKFIPSPDGVTQVANYNIGLLVDNYHSHEDCMCGGDDDFANNPLASGSKWLAIAIIEGDFIHDNENQNHFTDSKKHLNSVERGVLESLYTPTNVLAWDNNYDNAELGVASAKGFILSRPYITNGKFKEVRWTSQGTANGTNLYMKITLRDTNGSPVKSYVSNNSESFDVAGLKSYRFDEEWEVDDSISSISFEPCNEDGTIRTDAQIRIRVIGNAADNTSDGSESTNANYKINVQFYKIGSITNNFTSHVGDDTHLTTEEKAAIQQLVQNGSVTQQLVQYEDVTTDSYDWTPDYSAGVEFVCSPITTYTAPCNGWIIVYQKITTADGVPDISVNGVQILSLLNRTTSEDGLTITGELSGQFLVSENDVITGGVAGQEGIFYPCKGETAE